MRRIFKNFIFMFRTSAPLVVYRTYFYTLVQTILHRKEFKRIRSEVSDQLDHSGIFSQDFVTANAPYWLMLFSKYSIRQKRIKALEIGCWEGRSSVFLLQSLPGADLTSVDTWEGSDEYKGKDALAEKRFDVNVEAYKCRLQKYKGSSYSYFKDCADQGQFDFVYIDGSHHAEDVMCDAIKSFERLKVGGVLIFDDYLWNQYRRSLDNPAGAINSFLKLKKGTFEIVAVYYQVAIRKLKESMYLKIENASTQANHG